ncbi:MAG: macro domain-containing protein [Deltaproteobacteria bacterium]|nr:macro domain-containing protein [Deltaproteobacteria bacterium]
MRISLFGPKIDQRVEQIAQARGINKAELQKAIDASGLGVEEFLKFYANETVSSVRSDGNTNKVRGPNMTPVAELAGKIKKSGAAQKMSIGTVGNIPVTTIIGHLERTPADALVAPQWQGDAGSYGGGVGRALIGAGGKRAYEDYAAHCAKTETKYGDTHLSPSGVDLWPHVINAVTVGAGQAEEFKVIEDTTYAILKAAADAGLRSVAFPALGTGVIGRLTSEQSAKAITNGIARASKDGLQVEVAVVLWAGHPASAEQGFADFTKTITAGVFGGASEVGRKGFDLAAWVKDNTARVV